MAWTSTTKRPPASSGVVAFAGAAKFTAASTNPSAIIRGILVHLIRQFSQTGSAEERIVFKTDVREQTFSAQATVWQV
jgi:hypothetical protein